MSGAKEITLTVNGKSRTVAIQAGETLSSVLRREGFLGVKIGCNEGICGACTVILDGRAVNACHTLAYQAHDLSVETIEGLGSFEKPHPIQQALADGGAVQCGYCTPGLIMAAKALMDEIPNPTDEEFEEHLDGNLCRCTGYEKIQDALRKVAGRGVDSD